MRQLSGLAKAEPGAHLVRMKVADRDYRRDWNSRGRKPFLLAVLVPIAAVLYALFVIGHACALYGPGGYYGPPPTVPPPSDVRPGP